MSTWSDVVRCRWCGAAVLFHEDAWRNAIEVTTMGQKEPKFIPGKTHTCPESAADQDEVTHPLGNDGSPDA